MGAKRDWNIWRAYDKRTARTIKVGVAEVGEKGMSAFPMLDPSGVAYERRGTVHKCTKTQALDVMGTLFPGVIGLPS